jgi:hypothetical protein
MYFVDMRWLSCILVRPYCHGAMQAWTNRAYRQAFQLLARKKALDMYGMDVAVWK